MRGFLCLFLKLASAIFYIFQQNKVLKNYKKCFLCDLNCSFGSWSIQTFETFPLFAQCSKIERGSWQ